ncbi:PREDICTED: uncharacterized protein LOC108609597 [Drosophila arizonae]|uniref:Uncharacterized protein LOC108609597 n=1 Tax=Drosophila arizonae TaxID=7263 RepID=A0ABM1NPB9_DROAR|nr:PREDICTED: uncharacterized protein LOC108609597 [Drosophila arizonae]
MCFQLAFRVNAVLLLILFARQSNGLIYRFIPEDDEFFEDCDNAPSNALNLHGFVDTSQISFSRNNGIITVSGNTTAIWNIKPGDRIEGKAVMFQYDRGIWRPTQFSVTVRNCCAVIYDKPQYWYKYWTQHITNREEIKDQCFYPGTKMIYEPFEIDVLMQFTGLPLNGRYKIVTTFRAFDKRNVQRDTIICLQTVGEFERLD